MALTRLDCKYVDVMGSRKGSETVVIVHIVTRSGRRVGVPGNLSQLFSHSGRYESCYAYVRGERFWRPSLGVL